MAALLNITIASKGQQVLNTRKVGLSYASASGRHVVALMILMCQCALALGHSGGSHVDVQNSHNQHRNDAETRKSVHALQEHRCQVLNFCADSAT